MNPKRFPFAFTSKSIQIDFKGYSLSQKKDIVTYYSSFLHRIGFRRFTQNPVNWYDLHLMGLYYQEYQLKYGYRNRYQIFEEKSQTVTFQQFELLAPFLFRSRKNPSLTDIWSR